MSYKIDVIDQTIVLTLNHSTHFDVMLRAACSALLDILDEQQLPVFLIVDASELPNISCNKIVDRLPARAIQILFAHPRLREIIISAPKDIYLRHAGESMYKPYSARPILITQSRDLARGYVAETLQRH